MNVGEEIKKYRKEHGLNQTEFGALFNPPVPKSIVCTWEKMDRFATVKRRERLMELLAIPSRKILAQKYGNLIKALRLSKGMTLEEFGKLFNPVVAKGVVSRWENGESLPSPARIKQLNSIIEEKGVTTMRKYIEWVTNTDITAFRNGVNDVIKYEKEKHNANFVDIHITSGKSQNDDPNEDKQKLPFFMAAIVFETTWGNNDGEC